jgi:hypothetical protein
LSWLLKQQLSEVALVPTGLEAFALDSELGAGVVLQKSEGEMAQDSGIFRGIALAQARVVLAEG